MTELPHGTVTLLFTDVEGSTQLQHRLGDRYQEVVAEHRRLLESVFAEHRGVVVDRQMMRDDPPWVPFSNGARADFVSRSFGCYILQPVIGRLDIVAACKK